jgi:predicted transcriptional regulator YdeE
MEKFKIIGITVKTVNDGDQAANDIGGLRAEFLNDDIMNKIPNKVSSEIISVYTDYDGDYTDPYRVLIGCKVSSLENIPKGMIGREIESEAYAKFVCKGNILEGALYETWMDIWNTPLKRTYTADFEVYGEKAQDLENAEVDIYIAVE